MNGIDAKVIERIQKLLNLARDGGATEAEAALAMERAEEIMLSNNLSMATVEAQGGAAAEKRLKEAFSGRASFRWQRFLMNEIAKACFCHMIVVETRANIRFGATRRMQTGYEMIGRISNVTTAKQMFEYLNSTIARLRKEYGGSAKDGALFAEGVAARLRERIRDRHREMMQKQKEEAERANREQAARAAYPSAAPSNGSALVVILEDYATTEAEANNDILNGWPIGTTRSKREERQRKDKERQDRYDALLAEGIDSSIAWLMAYLGYSRERAEASEARRKEDAEERKGKKERTYRYRKTREERMEDLAYERSFSRQFQDGARAGDSVGLDEQIGKGSSTKKIGG